MKKMNKIISVIMAAAMAMSLAACGSPAGGVAGENVSSKEGSLAGENISAGEGTLTGDGVFTMAVATDPANVSPAAASTTGSTPIIYNIYTRLMYPKDGSYVMEAAESVEYEDDTHILVKLRDDVHDELGNQLTASDVLFSMNLCKDGGGSNPTYVRFVDLDSCEVVDDYTLRIAMASPYSFQYIMLSYVNLVTEAGYNASSDGMITDVVATGPYRVDEFVAGSYVILKANDKWFGDKPEIETVKIQVITETSQISNALETGEVQLGNIQASDMEYLENLATTETIAYPSAMLYGMFFNCTDNSIFKSKEARWAVAYAVNKTALLTAAMNGLGTECISAVTTDFNDYSPEWNNIAANHDDYYAYNLEKAKELADAAGLTGQTITMAYTSSQPVQKTMAEMVQAQLLEIGVNAEIAVYDDSVYVNTLQSNATDWDINFQIYGSLARTGLACMNTFIVAMNIPHVEGALGEKFNGLITEAITIVDDEKRMEMTNELVELLDEEVPILGLCQTTTNIGKSTDFSIGQFKITDNPDFASITWN